MDQAPPLPQAVFDKMMERDHFSKWLGLELLEIQTGYCRLRMAVRAEMLNGFGILHGGVGYAMADSAFAFASNSHGRISVSLSATASYPNAAHLGDTLLAEATELHLGNRTATYDIRVSKQDGAPVCLFRGTVFRTEKQVLGEGLSV